MSKKALFLDLDGTLLNHNKEITDGNRAAIDEMLSLGHQVIVTTGRPVSSAVIESHELGLDAPGCYLIAFNGGVIYDFTTRERIFESTIPLPLVEEIHAEAARRGLHIQAYDDERVIVEPRCDDKNVRRYCELINMEYIVIESIAELAAPPVKLLLSDYDDPSELHIFCDYINETYSGLLDAFFSCREYLEIVNTGMSKGSALRRLCENAGIDIADTIACGDAPNDIPMIEEAHIGCAMRNASEDVKAAADYVTERDNDHDGIAEVVRKFVLD